MEKNWVSSRMNLHFVDEEGKEFRVGFNNIAKEATAGQLSVAGEALASLKKDTLDGITVTEIHQIEDVL